MRHQISLFTLVIFITSLCAFGQYGANYFVPTETVVTPHITRAKPYAQGPVKALFITTRKNQREVIELAERMQLDYSVFTVGTDKAFSLLSDKDTAGRLIPGAAEKDMAQRLQTLLRDNYDVIVLGNIKFDILPQNIRRSITDAVSNGTGLIGVSSGIDDIKGALKVQDMPQSVINGIPYTALPAFAGERTQDSFAKKFFQYGQVGTGRVLLLSGFTLPLTQALTPERQGSLLTSRIDYDYYLAAVIKEILLVAKKEPTVTITPAQNAFTTVRGAADDLPFTLTGTAGTRMVDYEFIARDRYSNVYPVGNGTITAPAGGTTVSPVLGALPAGEYFLDLTLRARNLRKDTNAPVVSFASAALTVTSNSHLDQVNLARGDYSIKGPISGSVAIINPRANQFVRLEVFDNYNRLLATKDVAVNGAQLPFILDIHPTNSIMAHLTATLYLRDYLPENIIDRQVAEFSFNDFLPDPQDLRHIMWVTSYDNDFISPYVMSEFRNAGVDTQLGRFFPTVPSANLWHIPYQTRLVDNKTELAINTPDYRKKDDLVRDPCLTDPDYRDKLRAELTAQLNASAPFSTTELSMGDEDSFVTEKFDLCMSPTCNEDFRTFLKKEYNNSLYQVNREWGTNYRNWADVVPITLEEAKKNGHYPQWVDHRRHMEAVWAGIFAYGREVSQQVVPTARVGYEGSDRSIGSYTAVDYWKLSQNMNLNCTYNSDFHNAATRDFAVPGSLIGLGWFGGYAESRNTPYMRYQPWRTLLNGANSMWIWNGNAGVGSVIGYDLGMEDFYKASCAEINEMKAGPAKMLISSKRQHDGIAILWSPSSVHVATYTKGLDPQAAYDSLVRIISDLGLTSKIISYEVLANGGLRNDEFKTLILPQCQALSRAEITAIKNFVQAGGNVIADIRPGMTDEHGKPYPIGMLDEVFGVKHDDIENFNLGQGELKPTEDGFYLGTTRVDKNLRVTTGRAKGKVDAIPVMVTNKYGNGTADLFNLPLPEYAAKADAQLKDGDFVGYAGGKRLRKLFGNLLANDGVVPVVSITPEQPDVEINRYANGDIQYVGIMQKLARDPLAYSYGEAANPAGIPVKINFPPNKYLYDVRNGIYLGQTDSINTTLLPGVAQLYAVLPYRVTGLRLNAQQTVVAGESMNFVAQLLTAVLPGTHCLHVTVIDPAGVEKKIYAQNVLAANGKAIVSIPLALNDATGIWRVEVKDVATGVIGSANFTVVK